MSDTFERRRLRVYVAGPISADPMAGVHRATAVSRRMFLDGMAPFVPHWDTLWMLPDGNWPAYLEFDLEFVSVCDAVYRLKGYSQGADKEVSVAIELGIPIFYEEGEHDSHDGYAALLKHASRLGLNGVKQGVDRAGPA